jgi:hypothetical protein
MTVKRPDKNSGLGVYACSTVSKAVRTSSGAFVDDVLGSTHGASSFVGVNYWI